VPDYYTIHHGVMKRFWKRTQCLVCPKFAEVQENSPVKKDRWATRKNRLQKTVSPFLFTLVIGPRHFSKYITKYKLRNSLNIKKYITRFQNSSFLSCLRKVESTSSQVRITKYKFSENRHNFRPIPVIIVRPCQTSHNWPLSRHYEVQIASSKCQSTNYASRFFLWKSS